MEVVLGPGVGVRINAGPGTLAARNSRDEGMLAMAEADGEVAVRDPNKVISEIESTRENLARTIDALTERVNPGNVARRSLERVREQVARPEVQLAGGAVILVTAAVVAYSLWRRRR
jgi:hypothetical protein